MEINQLLYDAFTFYGPLAFTVYLKEREVELQGDEMRRLIVHCLPKHFDAPFPPMLQKFGHFVGKKASFLFRLKDQSHESPLFTDTSLLAPSFESYLNLTKKERLGLFFRSVRKDDIIVAKIVHREENRYFAEVICFAHKKQRVIDDLHFRVILDCDKDMEIGTLIRATFCKTSIKERQLFISINDEDLPKQSNPDSLKLGIITEDELPLYYRRMKENSGIPFNEVLKNCIPKTNENCSKMLKYFNSDCSDVPSYTLLASEFKSSPEKTASYIHKKQMSDLSNYNHKLGMECYIRSEKTDALKYFNESLKLNPKNIDSLFSCGTIFMNRKDYKTAIEMFEKILEIKDSHERAKQFLCNCLEKLIRACDKDDYVEIFKASVKLLEYNPDHDFAEKCFLRTMFHAHYSDELGLPWFKGGHYVKVVEDYPSSGSDMDIEETEDGKIEVEVPETEKRASAVSIKEEKENAPVSASSKVEEQNEKKSSPEDCEDISKEQHCETEKLKSDNTGGEIKTVTMGNVSTPSIKPEVNINEETPKPLETDLHKIKCDEFISSNLKKRSVSRHSIDSRSAKKVKHSKRHRSHSKRHRHHKKRQKEKHRSRHHSRSSSRHREEDNLTDNLSDISSGSDICDRPKRDPYVPSPPPSTSRSTYFHHDVRRRSESPERSRSPPRSRTVHLRTRKHSDSSDQPDRSRSRSRHSTSHSPVRYLDDYQSSLLPRSVTSNVSSYPPVPVELVSRSSYSSLAKNNAVKIIENILADSRK